jgi:hypothetical protein
VWTRARPTRLGGKVNEELNTERLGCAGNYTEPIAGLGLGRGVHAFMVDTRRLLLGAILRVLQGRNVMEEVMYWSELAELTHATQVEKFNFCLCEDNEGQENPYADCPKGEGK